MLKLCNYHVNVGLEVRYDCLQHRQEVENYSESQLEVLELQVLVLPVSQIVLIVALSWV